MAAHPNPNHPPSTKRSLSPLGWLRAGITWAGQSRMRAMLAVASVVLAVIGGGAAATLILSQEKPPSEPKSLAPALALLDARDFAAARRLADEYRTDKTLSYEDQGAALFVVGACVMHDADEHLAPAEKKLLFVLAARYLEESRLRGFPTGREREALFLLGRSLHYGGQLEKSAAILREALSHDPAQSAEVHRLLADGYLQMSPPRLAEALDHNRLFLAAADATPHDRELAVLFEARLHWARNDRAACRESLARIPATSSLHDEATILAARIAIREADELRESDGERAAKQAQQQYQQTLVAIRALLARAEAVPATIAAGELLEGVCFERLGDKRAAAEQFERVRRTHFGRPESLAATMFLAELKRQAGQIAVAASLYERIVREAGPRDGYLNAWLSLTELETGLQGALEDFLARQDFPRALALGKSLPPVFGEVKALERQARVLLAWADYLQRQAETRPGKAAKALRNESRQHRREAGLALEQLARLRFATEFYPDDLTASAQSFLDGRGYEQAARVYRQLLRQDIRAREPDALAGLGLALLSLGKTDAALATLGRCRELYPKHPATYRGRLLIAVALAEKGRLAEAEKALSDNLYNFALTPQSTEWRESLFALGDLQYREALERETQSRQAGVDQTDAERRQAGLAILEQSSNLFEEAIRTLTEATRRYPDDPQTPIAQYRLAEAYRQRSKWPRKKLGMVTIETTRVALNRQIQTDLQAAVEEYSRLIERFGNETEASGRATVAAAILRNCYFGRADALFDLGRYDEAAKAYSAASNRYQHEPEALEAYVQIAACYRRLDRPGDARNTLEQARVVLGRLKPETNFTTTTRYNREEWTQLLAWLATL
jgi:TolA-binding protein